MRFMDLRRSHARLGVRVPAGTLDDTSWLRPTVHFWTRNKQPWVALPEGNQSFATQPADLQGFLSSTR